ncbi:MAG: hypothetical protein ABI352_02610 [Candidatus Dormibacter sp.]
MTRRWIAWSTAAALLSAALLACGSSSTGGGGAPTTSQSAVATPTGTAQATSPAAQSGTLDVCALATQSDVDAAAGVSLGPAAAQPAPNPGSSKCSWQGSGAPVGLFEPGITIAVVPLPAGAPVSSLPFFNGQIAGAKRITGLGDVAASLSPGQLGPSSVEIFVATHGGVLTLTLATAAPHTADPVQSMITLARAVVGRYP